MTAFSGPQPPTNLNHELAAGTEGAHPCSQRGSRVTYEWAKQRYSEPRRGEMRIVRGMPGGIYFGQASGARSGPSACLPLWAFPIKREDYQESSHLVLGQGR